VLLLRGGLVACGSGKGAGAVSARRTGQEGSGEGSRKKKEGKKKRREEKKRRKEKEKRKKWRGRTGEIGKEENINGKNGKGVRKIKRIPWEKYGKDFCGGFQFFGRQRDFRDGDDGEADRPAGPRRCEIPIVVADRGAGAARVGDGPSAGGAGGIRGTRAEGKESTGVSKGGK
jgi:hypothetical protein